MYAQLKYYLMTELFQKIFKENNRDDSIRIHDKSVHNLYNFVDIFLIYCSMYDIQFSVLALSQQVTHQYVVEDLNLLKTSLFM